MQSRRSILIAGFVLLTGCSSTQHLSSRRREPMPDVPWPRDRQKSPYKRVEPTWRDTQRPTGRTTNTAQFEDVLSRSSWAGGAPLPTRMDHLGSVTSMTVHHDGMDAFNSRSSNDAAVRLERIRRAHVNKGWGDIGYHYIVDPAGRVWEGRPLTYQGAHVKYHNPHNIGVMCLGNFDIHQPSSDQLDALKSHISRIMRTYKLGTRQVRTHQELSPTACPGRNLQNYMSRIRRNGALA